MGDVISLTRVTDVDIFSEFDSQCPAIPEDIDRVIPRSAGKAVGAPDTILRNTSLRKHSLLLVALSVLLLFTVNLIISAMPSNSADLSSSNTDYRQSRDSWVAFIQSLESDPLHQRVVEEKRLFAHQYP